MENADKIHRQLAAKPFRPFWIHTKAGTQVRVGRPEWYWEPPDGYGEFVVFDTHGYSHLNYRDVTSMIIVETSPPPTTNGEISK